MLYGYITMHGQQNIKFISIIYFYALFAKLRKAAISFVMSVRPSFCPR